MDSTNDTYRWYLCYEDRHRPMSWSCVRSTEKDALKPFIDGPIQMSSKAIPINTMVPTIFDYVILHKILHPRIKMTL